jgi:opacity protein-like surface antigen
MRNLPRASPRLVALLASLLPCLAFAQAQPPPPMPPPPPPMAPPMMQEQGGKFELSAFGGWATSSDVNTYNGTLKIGDTNSWGASVGFRTPYKGSLVVLKWIYYDPEVRLDSFGSSTKVHVPTNYILLGGEKGIRRGRIEPFFGGSLGTAIFSPSGFTLAGTHYSPGTTWRMAFGLGGGLKIFATPKLAIRLGAEMVAPIFFQSTSFYIGTGGAGLGVSGGIPTVTGNFTVGVTFVP